jgi:hypothetical protein
MGLLKKMTDIFSTSSKTVALNTVRRGKRFVYLLGFTVFGAIFFFGINLVFYIRNPREFGKPNLAIWLLATFGISEIVGYFWSRNLWSKYKRLSKE